MTSRHDKAPMTPERRALIAQAWTAVVNSGATATLLKKGMLEVWIHTAGPEITAVSAGPDVAVAQAQVRESIRFVLGTPRGTPAFVGIPVLCEDEEFGLVYPG